MPITSKTLGLVFPTRTHTHVCTHTHRHTHPFSSSQSPYMERCHSKELLVLPNKAGAMELGFCQLLAGMQHKESFVGEGESHPRA